MGKILFYFLTGVAPLLISGAAFALRFPEGTLSEQFRFFLFVFLSKSL